MNTRFLFGCAIAALLACQPTFSQTQPPTSGVINIATALNDVNQNPFTGVIHMRWGEQAPREVRITKTDELTSIAGETGTTLIHKSLALYTGLSNEAAIEIKNLKTDFAGIETGKKWTLEYVITQTPVSWCPSSNDMTFTTTLQVGEKQTLELTILGEKKTIEVLPIYEKGSWKRCYTGKMLRRFFYSKDLDMVMSAETAMYSATTGKLGTTYSFQFTALK